MKNNRRHSLARLAAAVIFFAAAPCHADGYNDWAGAVADPGELYVVPAVQPVLTSTWSAYWQLQFQLGLADKIDLITSLATTQVGGAFEHDGLYVQPRYAISDQTSVSLGLFVPASVADTGVSLIPGVFSTTWLSPERWKLNWNATFYVPVAAPAGVETFSVGVLERRFSPGFSVFFEGDLHGTVDALALDVLVGALWELSDVDSLNVSLMMPTVPKPEPGALAVGVWYARGIEISALQKK